MLLCGKCRAPIHADRCPLCGKTKHLRQAVDGDEIYLTSAEYLWSRVVEDALNEADIPFTRHGDLGMGIAVSIGDLREVYRYYVMYPDYERALTVLPEEDAEMSEEELNAYIDSLGDVEPS